MNDKQLIMIIITMIMSIAEFIYISIYHILKYEEDRRVKKLKKELEDTKEKLLIYKMRIDQIEHNKKNNKL